MGAIGEPQRIVTVPAPVEPDVTEPGVTEPEPVLPPVAPEPEPVGQ